MSPASEDGKMDALSCAFLVVFLSGSNTFSSFSQNLTNPRREQGPAESAFWRGYQVHAVAVEQGEANSIEIMPWLFTN